jgi:uncharacterized protein YutE (UPF0331/DUF86 family)
MAPLGIDKEKLSLQLGRLEEHLIRLKEIQGKLKQSKEEKEVTLLPAGERLLQLSIEECLNIGSHLIAGLGFKRADTYREVFTRLREKKIISPELGRIMEDFASFRNRLVHLYWEVTAEDVIQKLKEIGFLKKFAQEVLKFSEKK